MDSICQPSIPAAEEPVHHGGVEDVVEVEGHELLPVVPRHGHLPAARLQGALGGLSRERKFFFLQDYRGEFGGFGCVCGLVGTFRSTVLTFPYSPTDIWGSAVTPSPGIFDISHQKTLDKPG